MNGIRWECLNHGTNCLTCGHAAKEREAKLREELGKKDQWIGEILRVGGRAFEKYEENEKKLREEIEKWKQNCADSVREGLAWRGKLAHYEGNACCDRSTRDSDVIQELNVENGRLRAVAKRYRKALMTISDMPVLDWCSEMCTKWQPSNLAFQALAESADVLGKK